MFRRSHFRIAAFAGLLGLCPLTSSAAELHHPGVSARGATGAATQWNLICDPLYADHGSTSTQYDPDVSSLFEVTGLGPYSVSELLVQVQAGGQTSFVPFTPNASGVAVVDSSKFPSGGTETGLAQVFWGLTGTPPLPAAADDTHMLVFNNITANPNAIGTFTDYLDKGVANGGMTPTPDFYTGFMPDLIDPSMTDPFTYSADPTSQYYAPDATSETAIFQVGTPEPSSVALLGILATAGLLRRPRKQPQ